MSQLIQTLHRDADAPKGFMLDQVKAKLDAMPDADKTVLHRDLDDLINFANLSDIQRIDLAKRLTKVNLLSDGAVNPKTAKTLGLNISNHILHLTPSDLSGLNVCPAASKGCRAACLNGAGRGLFDAIQLPRLRRTLYFKNFRTEFLSQLDREISKIDANAKRDGKTAVVRLNGTSDLPFEMFKVRDGKNLFELYQDVTFYDYTKVYSRLARLKLMRLKNYHVTFSASESNHADAKAALGLGFNVAMVFDSIPTEYKGFRVIDGDAHDFRFLDQGQGVIVGLKAKGPAKRDASGFVRRIERKAA